MAKEKFLIIIFISIFFINSDIVKNENDDCAHMNSYPKSWEIKKFKTKTFNDLSNKDLLKFLREEGPEGNFELEKEKLSVNKATIDCDDVKIQISQFSHYEINVHYSTFPFDFSFPHSRHEGFTIEEVKIILPHMYYKFDNFSLTGANFFSNRFTCRRFNLETGVDELLFWNCW